MKGKYYSELNSILNSQEKMFDSVFNNLSETLKNESICACKVGVPVINEYDDEWGKHFEIAMPGYSKEEVSVQIVNRRISFVLKEKEMPEGATVIAKMINVPTEFELRIPSKFDLKKLEAELKSGIMYLAIPIKEEEKPQTINVEVK